MSRIIVFIENQNYFKFTKPYLDVFEKLSVEYEIFTLGNLNNFNIKSSKVTVFDNQKALNKSLLTLECDYFLTTTPGIGNFYFSKSKILPKNKRPKYIYFFHSLVSPNENYAENSFNGYDIILSPNSTITNHLGYLINKKKTQIITVGYQYLERKSLDYEDTNNVLIAPSWGKDNLFSDKYNQQFINLIEILQKNGKKIFLRPHPMDLNNLTKLKENINLNLYLLNKIDFHNFDYLITDWSGISLEYFYSTRKVVGFLNTPKKIKRKLKSKELELDLTENMVRNKIGPIIDLNNIEIDVLFNFKYERSEYIDNLFLPEFQNKNIENILRDIIN